MTQRTNITEKNVQKSISSFNCLIVFRIKVSCHLKIKMVVTLSDIEQQNTLVPEVARKVLYVSEDEDPDDNKK